MTTQPQPPDRYLAAITSQHRRRPKFAALVAAITAPLADLQETLEDLRQAFDLATAVGLQLDQVGQWVGLSRHLQLPLEGVYFAWDEDGVGWAEGVWRGPFDPDSGLIALPDDVYRQLLRARVAANAWDGTRDGAYAAWETAFADEGSLIVLQDNQDMSIGIGIAGLAPSRVLERLLVGGALPLKPAGVRVAYYALPPTGIAGALFGWDCDGPALAGWGEAAWPRILAPE